MALQAILPISNEEEGMGIRRKDRPFCEVVKPIRNPDDHSGLRDIPDLSILRKTGCKKVAISKRLPGNMLTLPCWQRQQGRMSAERPTC